MTLSTPAAFPDSPIAKTGWPWTETTALMPDKEMMDKGNWPKISIVTPSFNQADYIEETIRSVLLQGYPNLEFIIIDGKSSDKSVEIIKKYEAWLSFWVSEPDNGQSHAINKGFSRATGSIYAYLNSDDVYLPGVLFRAAEAIGSSGKTKLISFACDAWDGQDQHNIHLPDEAVPDLYTWLMSGKSLMQPSTFWSATLHNKVGGFDENLHFSFDKKFFTSALFIEGEYLADRTFVGTKFRIHQNSKTSTLNELRFKENELIKNQYLQIESLASEFEQLTDKAGPRLEAMKLIDQSIREKRRIRKIANLMHALKLNPRILSDKYYMHAWYRCLFRPDW